MVLVNTRVPDTNATPSITASTVMSSLALCASTLRRAVRNISLCPGLGYGWGRRSRRACPAMRARPLRARGFWGRSAQGRGARVSARAALGVEPLHPVQHRLRARLVQLVHD